MKLFRLLLSLLVWEQAAAAKVHKHAPPADVGSPRRMFATIPNGACVGKSFTEFPEQGCDGWRDLTQSQCQQKCADHSAPDECVPEQCHAAVYYPASGLCHLYMAPECVDLIPTEGAITMLDESEVQKYRDEEAEETQEEEEEVAAEKLQPNPWRELGTALPTVLVNLSNYAGWISDQDKVVNISHKFGNVDADLALLYDKVTGFYSVLHEQMNDGDGEKYCPFKTESTIKRCITIATCLLQSAVGKYIPMTAYASLMEQVTRFDDITWPELMSHLAREDKTHTKVGEDELPLEYRCDDTEVVNPDATVRKLSLLQMETRHAQGSSTEATLAMSAALREAIADTHRILDGHGTNTSMNLTAHHLQRTWHPLCRQLGCDASNMHDVFVASHKQTIALFQTSAVAHMRLEIQQRVKMDFRVQRFIAEHGHKGQLSFFRPSQTSSNSAASAYGEKGRDGVISVVLPTMKALVDHDESRALRLVDLEQFEKIRQQVEDEAKTDSDSETEDDVHVAHVKDALRSLEDDEEEQDEHREEDEEEHGDEIMLPETNDDQEELEAVQPRDAHQLALLETFGELAEAETGEVEDKSSGGRRRRRRRRRRRWLRRRRRRWLRKVWRAVKKAVVKWAKKFFECFGHYSAWDAVGYTKSFGGNFGMSFGFSGGHSGSIKDLISGRMFSSGWVSINFGMAVGTSGEWWWGGVGVSGGVSCSTGGSCRLGVSVGAIGCGWWDVGLNAACPFDLSTWGIKCQGSKGGTFLVTCCGVDLVTGQNDCR